MIQIVLFLFLCFTSVALPAPPMDAVSHITNLKPEPGAPGRYAGGSATLVGISGDRGLLVSAGHIFENGGRSAEGTFPSVQGTWKMKVLECRQDPDIAILELRNPPDIATPPCVRVARQEDGPFTCAGYPYNGHGQLHNCSGDWLGCDNSMLTLRCMVISGYSGGAIFNRHGEYVGNVCGRRGTGNSGKTDRTYGFSGEVLKRYVGKYMEVKQ